jgi:integrase
LIVTGQRREEVAALDWAELDRDTATWVLPAGRAKNGQAHIVPLSALALVVLDEVAANVIDAREDEPQRWPSRGLVFTTKGQTAFSGHSKAKARLDVMMEKLANSQELSYAPFSLELSPWRVHDLRRTLATGLQRLGIRFEVTEAVLNHVSGSKGGIAGVYQRHDWKDEKRAALEAWGRHLSVAINAPQTDNVVSLEDRRVAR